MSRLGVERWRRASTHLDRVLDLAPAERDEYLMSLRAANPQVAGDVVRSWTHVSSPVFLS